jgi:hypothetical protein
VKSAVDSAADNVDTAIGGADTQQEDLRGQLSTARSTTLRDAVVTMKDAVTAVRELVPPTVAAMQSCSTKVRALCKGDEAEPDKIYVDRIGSAMDDLDALETEAGHLDTAAAEMSAVLEDEQEESQVRMARRYKECPGRAVTAKRRSRRDDSSRPLTIRIRHSLLNVDERA